MKKTSELSLRIDRAHLLCHAARRSEFARIGIWRGQMPILDYVDTHENCTQISLAEALSLSAASVAVSLKRMEKAGLVLRSPDPDNLRQNRLSLTKRGRETILEARAAADESNEAFFSPLSEEEREELFQILGKLIASTGAETEISVPLENYILKQKLEKETEETSQDV